jgi:tetratricopeptide (TPR) repeat protein
MRSTSLLLLLAVMLQITAANKPDKSDPADEMIRTGQYDQAISFLSDAYHKAPNDTLAGRVAETYVMARKYDHALTWLGKMKDLEKVERGRHLITKGDALFGLGQADKALDMYTLYSGITGDNTDILDRVSAVRALQRAGDKDELWTIEHLPFNTAGDEWFVTNFRTRELMISNHHAPGKNAAYVDFFTLEREYDKWLDPKPLMKPEDENHRRNGVTFSRDGNTVYFTENVTETVTTGTGKNTVSTVRERTALYRATILANRFSDISELKLVPAGYSMKDPCIDVTGTILYFASDMPGGMGGFDLYLSRFVKGRWLLPENLGPAVNSAYDEMAPYVRQDNLEHTLYFASDRPFGFGGLDLYHARQEGGRYMKAELLPPPINTAADERSIMFDTNKMSGYLTSNRPGGSGGFDVYWFKPYAITLTVKVSYGGQQATGFAKGILSGHEALANNDGNMYFPVIPGKKYDLSITANAFEPYQQQVTISENELQDTVKLSASLIPAPVVQASVAQEETEYIDLHIVVKDQQNNMVPWYLFTIINLQTSKVRKIQADESGLLEQYLLPESDYRIIAKELAYDISERISTRAVKPGSTIKYVLRLSDNGYTLSPYSDN